MGGLTQLTIPCESFYVLSWLTGIAILVIGLVIFKQK